MMKVYIISEVEIDESDGMYNTYTVNKFAYLNKESAEKKLKTLINENRNINIEYFIDYVDIIE